MDNLWIPALHRDHTMAQARVALALCALLLVAGVAPRAEAVSYNVGNSAGWDPSADLPSWAGGKTFYVGDVLGTYEPWLATSSSSYPCSVSCTQEPNVSRFRFCFTVRSTGNKSRRRPWSGVVLQDA